MEAMQAQEHVTPGLIMLCQKTSALCETLGQDAELHERLDEAVSHFSLAARLATSREAAIANLVRCGRLLAKANCWRKLLSGDYASDVDPLAADHIVIDEMDYAMLPPWSREYEPCVGWEHVRARAYLRTLEENDLRGRSSPISQLLQASSRPIARPQTEPAAKRQLNSPTREKAITLYRQYRPVFKKEYLGYIKNNGHHRGALKAAAKAVREQIRTKTGFDLHERNIINAMKMFL